MTDRELMQQALDALEATSGYDIPPTSQVRSSITALRTALAMHQVSDFAQAQEQQAEPICPECKAAVLYECVACSSNNYPPQQQAEPPPEWESIKNILDEYGLDAIAFVKAWKAVQQRAEPVAWSHAGAMPPEQEVMKEAAYNLAPWLSAALDDPKVCKEYKDAINAWFDAAMPAPQRQWVGLEAEEILDLFDRNNVYGSKWVEFARTVEAKLKERNT